MRLNQFKIERFRSIKATGWLPFSEDGITVLVGQNESGKSSILDALHLGFSIDPNIQEDDFRIGEGLPSISIRFDMDEEDFKVACEELPDGIPAAAKKILWECRHNLEICASIQRTPKLTRILSVPAELVKVFENLASDEVEAEDGDAAQVATLSLTSAQLAGALFRAIPAFVLFRDQTCQLPNSIDITGGKLASKVGSTGAANFLRAANLDLGDLLGQNDRTVATTLSKANERVTADLQAFWSQVLGQTRKIRLECELKYRPARSEENVGEPYLVFWVSESGQKLYPSQRSKGTRWFISFYLQLTARRVYDYSSVVLLDEPGAYLHAAAQKDVIQLIEHLAAEMPVIYSTHSPYLLDHRKLHRLLAVERLDEADESPTCVRRGMELATASPLTLAPILTLIGVDLAQQEIIKRERNVIMEEISAFYYFLSFGLLLQCENRNSFVAASGADNVRLLVDLFIAWRIDFAVLVDDDQHGKRVCRDIKSKYGMSDEFSSARLLRLSGCEGVEDMFEPQDFARVVLGEASAPSKRNSTYVKEAKKSKPLLAVNFYNRVRAGSITKGDLSDVTVENFSSAFDRLDKAFGSRGEPLDALSADAVA